ncbi:MAG: hypothetical protein ACI8QZ_000533 [Chlamydiales bacterium]|jgi:hypothetical protein
MVQSVRPGSIDDGGVVWHPHEFVFETGELGAGGVLLDEASPEPLNPWLNWRLSATFRGPDGEVFTVPGFYAGSAQGSGVGDVWKVRFAPHRPGVWSITPRLEYASFPINVEPLDVGGERQIPLQLRSFRVDPPDASAPGFLARGPLRYAGKKYLAFPDGGLWVKGGTNSPENFFGYSGFDNAEDRGGAPIGQSFLHSYGPHVADWQAGDPDWSTGGNSNAGRGIIGALNYLASRGVNSIYFLPNNLGGDGQDTFPFTQPLGDSYSDTHWDASRMEQWNVVMEHAMRKGIFLQLVLAEQEWDSVHWLGFGLTTERKLFFKNLVAMFGHHPAIKFTFCEENGADPGAQFTTDELHDFAEYLGMWDAYDHPLSIHNRADDLTVFTQILDGSVGKRWLTSTSLQLHDDYGAGVEAAHDLALLNDGLPLVIDQDEQGNSFEGLSNSNAHERRKEVLYDVYFSGGNIEWYLGYASQPAGGDFDVEDLRTREAMWDFMRHARTLLESVRFWRMHPDDDLLQGETVGQYGGAEVFAETGRDYLIYYPCALDTGTLDLRSLSSGRVFDGHWFNPRTGIQDSVWHGVPSGELYSMPAPPANPDEDWVFVVRRR